MSFNSTDYYCNSTLIINKQLGDDTISCGSYQYPCQSFDYADWYANYYKSNPNNISIVIEGNISTQYWQDPLYTYSGDDSKASYWSIEGNGKELTTLVWDDTNSGTSILFSNSDLLL